MLSFLRRQESRAATLNSLDYRLRGNDVALVL
jgi:hypothetical protein